MKILTIYGGRGLLDDPTLIAIKRLEKVYKELEIDVELIELYKNKEKINTLPNMLNEYNGILLAASVDWFGIGGLLTSFLDACWYYWDKKSIGKLRMMPVVCSTTYGERDAEEYLTKAWELLGGIACDGVIGYFDNATVLEMNEQYLEIIEKKAEDFYRILKQDRKALPKSFCGIDKQIINNNDSSNIKKEMPLIFSEDDHFVKKQKEDIQELSNFFKEKLKVNNKDPYTLIIEEFKKYYNSIINFKAIYKIDINDNEKVLNLIINNDVLKCTFEDISNEDVYIKTTYANLNKIVNGQMTFQRGFMSGELTARGDFKLLYSLDALFPFKASVT